MNLTSERHDVGEASFLHGNGYTRLQIEERFPATMTLANSGNTLDRQGE